MLRAAAMALAAASSLPHPAAAEDVRDRMAREIARLRTEITALERIGRWQERLLRAAESDPAAALLQRRPMEECRASPLAPVCGRLGALFDDGTDGGGTRTEREYGP